MNAKVCESGYIQYDPENEESIIYLLLEVHAAEAAIFSFGNIIMVVVIHLKDAQDEQQGYIYKNKNAPSDQCPVSSFLMIHVKGFEQHV